jgi:hypothetical protein
MWTLYAFSLCVYHISCDFMFCMYCQRQWFGGKNAIIFNLNLIEFLFQHWECKLLYTLFHYVLTANYMWILVEGLYLHTLVYVSVFSERGSVKWYYLLGWGKIFIFGYPILFILLIHTYAVWGLLYSVWGSHLA